MEWRPAGWSVCLPLLIFPCTIKSRSFLLAPAHPGGPGKRVEKWLCVCAQQNNILATRCDGGYMGSLSKPSKPPGSATAERAGEVKCRIRVFRDVFRSEVTQLLLSADEANVRQLPARWRHGPTLRQHALSYTGESIHFNIWEMHRRSIAPGM